MWASNWIALLIQDLRYAARQLRRQPTFTLTAVLTLALGFGTNIAIFSVADALLLRPLPFPNSDRLVMVWNELSKLGVHDLSLSAVDFEAFSADSRVFQNTVAFKQEDRNLLAAGNAERVSTISSTQGLLEMLGSRYSLGRRLTPNDWKADRNQVAILSYSIFVRRFAANPSVIGQTIRLDDTLYTIVGVLAKGFESGLASSGVDVWTPLPPVHDRGAAQFRMLALVRPGMNLEAAQNSVRVTASRMKQTIHPYEGPNGEDGGYTARAISLHDQLLGSFRTGTLILIASVGLVLLIACVNVANLLLARTAGREKEIALRRALGASQPRLLRQWLTEAGLLTALGAVAGLISSFGALDLLKSLLPAELPAIVGITVDAPDLLFTFVLSAVTCFLFSIAPIRSAVQITDSLRGPRRHAARVLIATEVALALMLLVGSGLLLKSFVSLRQIDAGIHPDHLLTMLVELSGVRYEKPRQKVQFFSQLQSRLARLPGAVSVSAVNWLPVFTAGVDTRSGNPFSVEGSPWKANAPIPVAHTPTVGLNYFRTMGVPLLAGRTFTAADTLESTPVALVNQTLARGSFPKQNPIGRRILLGAPAPGAKWLTIVGIVGNVRTGALDLPPMPQFYTPETQDANSRMFLVLRTSVDPRMLIRNAFVTVRQLDPQVSPDHFSTMQEHVDTAVAQPRFETLLLAFFGASALFLSGIGIYGVVSNAVIRRTKEIGIRMALGASLTGVALTVLVDTLRPVAAGVVLGLAGAGILARFLSSVLYQVRPGDPVILAAAALILSLVAVLACLGPARRAAAVDPTVALKYE